MNCLNCKKAIEKEMKFCPYCGQKNTDGKVRVLTYFAEFFSFVFNIEGKLFTTIRHIFVPGKLTVEYFRGKRIRYFHPLRLFLVLAAFFLASITISIKDDLNGIDLVESNTITEATTVEIAQKIDRFNQENCPLYDSTAYTGIENLRRDILGDYEDVPEGSDSMDIDFGGFKLNMKGSDILKYNAEEIIKKNNIEGFWRKFLTKQGIKLFKNRKNFMEYLISISLWLILLMMPFLAVILKIFYMKKYYIEHLVFSLHTHSFLFLLLTSTILLNYFFNTDEFIGILLLITAIYLFMALKAYYLQSWKLTFVKFSIINFFYLILACSFLLLVLAFGFAFF